MKSIKTVQAQLDSLKESVVGIFRVTGNFELVVDVQDTNKTVDTIRITEFGAIHINYNIPQSFGTLLLFPDEKNMNQMLNDVVGWQEFMEQFDTN